MNSIIIRIDPEGRVTFLNDYGARFFGYSAEELRGKHVVGTIVPRQNTPKMDARALIDYIVKHSEQYRENEIENIRRDGEKVWVSWTVKPLHEAGGAFSGILAVGNDITEPEETRRTAPPITKDGSHRHPRRRRPHDFNNMLAVILGNAELALDDLKGNDGPDRNIDHIIKASKRARELVKQILTFASRNDKGKKPLELADLVKETYTLLRGSLPSTIRMELDLQADSSTILADRSQVQQIIMNLATNAADAMFLKTLRKIAIMDKGNRCGDQTVTTREETGETLWHITRNNSRGIEGD